MARNLPIPVSVIGGFLGAGKTTLLNRLLAEADGRRFGLIVNDFGDINIDERLIVARDEEMISLANGCICCSIGSDFLRALVALVSREDPPDHIVIEASGVANPARIAALAQADRELFLHGVTVLVDLLNFQQQLADPLLTDTMEGQVRAADLVILSKSDLAGADRIAAARAAVSRIAPDVRMVDSSVAALPVDLLFDLRHREVPPDAGDHTAHAAFATGTIVSDSACDIARLQLALDALSVHVLRVKGVVIDADGKSHIVQWVAGRLDLTSLEGEAKKPAPSELVYVCIGETVDNRIEASLMSAFS